MEKNRNSKVIAIIALLVAVVGLSVGFATYSALLEISSSAHVTPTDDFDVYFSTTDESQSTGDVTPVVKVGGEVLQEPSTGDPSGDAATLTETTISGLRANFTEPGQEIVYSFYAHNVSDYVAYLNKVNFVEIAEGKTKTCTASNVNTIGVNEACADISIKVQVGGTTADKTFTATNENVGGHTLAKNGYESVIVTITYADNGNRANGDFEVAFGDIKLTYNEVE